MNVNSENKALFMAIRNKFKRHDQDIDENYLDTTPSNYSSLALYNKWISNLPDASMNEGIPLFHDVRIAWLMSLINVRGLNVLELGPLEAGHTYMLEKLGGANVLAIEANKNYFLKSLIIKNIYDLKSKFYLGNFNKYIKHTDAHYDLCVASGVLYHMIEPIELILDLERIAKNIFLWTHYYNPDRIDIKYRFEDEKKYKLHNNTYRMKKQYYPLKAETFCGGLHPFSYWLYRDDLIGLLKALNFSVDINFEQVDHPNGSALCIFAQKK